MDCVWVKIFRFHYCLNWFESKRWKTLLPRWESNLTSPACRAGVLTTRLRRHLSFSAYRRYSALIIALTFWNVTTWAKCAQFFESRQLFRARLIGSFHPFRLRIKKKNTPILTVIFYSPRWNCQHMLVVNNPKRNSRNRPQRSITDRYWVKTLSFLWFFITSNCSSFFPR